MAKKKKSAAAKAPEKASVAVQVSPTQPITQAVHEAPLIFVDGGAGIGVAEDMVRFNFYQDRLTPDVKGEGHPTQFITRTICARIVMSVKTAQAVVKWLGRALEEEEERKKDAGGE